MSKQPPPISELQQIFFGRSPGGQSAWVGVFTGTVRSSNAVDVFVQLDGFGDQNTTFSARYERRLGASPATPPAGTRCIVVFPSNEPDHSPWATTFVGWP